MFVTSSSNCLSSVHLSWAVYLSTGCLRHGLPCCTSDVICPVPCVDTLSLSVASFIVSITNFAVSTAAHLPALLIFLISFICCPKLLLPIQCNILVALYEITHMLDLT